MTDERAEIIMCKFLAFLLLGAGPRILFEVMQTSKACVTGQLRSGTVLSSKRTLTPPMVRSWLFGHASFNQGCEIGLTRKKEGQTHVMNAVMQVC